MLQLGANNKKFGSVNTEPNFAEREGFDPPRRNSFMTVQNIIK